MIKNSLLLGVFLGVVFPALSYVLTTYTSLQESLFSGKPIAIYVIAAVFNLILFRFTYRSGKDEFAKGVLITTFLAMLVLVFGTNFKI